MTIALMLAATAQAQQQQAEAEPAWPEFDTDAVAAPREDVTTLGVVQALRPDEEPLDLYRFKNPVQVESNRFDRSWREPPTPEQVSLSGGYLMMGLYQGVRAAAKGLHKLTNGPDQIQSAIARPPPLSEDQLRRAAANCEGQACGAGEN